MKRLLLLSGLSLLGVAVGQAGVGPGVAGGLSVTSPLMGVGQVGPVYSPPVITAGPKPIYTPGQAYSGPARPPVVAPLPGESLHAPVAVTVGPTVHPEQGTRDLLQAPIGTPTITGPSARPQHGLRGWLHRHHWLH